MDQPSSPIATKNAERRQNQSLQADSNSGSAPEAASEIGSRADSSSNSSSYSASDLGLKIDLNTTQVMKPAVGTDQNRSSTQSSVSPDQPLSSVCSTSDIQAGSPLGSTLCSTTSVSHDTATEAPAGTSANATSSRSHPSSINSTITPTPIPNKPGGRRHLSLSILPSVFTSLNLLCGYLSIISTSQDEFLAAGWFVVLAVICDILDGRLARLTSLTSRFGAELDSLADLVSFGVAPAFLVFRRYLSDTGVIGVLCTALFVLCGALRLARFNITPPSDRDVFTGLPIPAAAGILCTLTIIEMQFFPFLRVPDSVIPIIVIIASFLMVSTIEYPAMKKTKRTSGQRRLVVLAFLIFLALFPPLCLFLLSWGFAIYGPFMYIFKKMANFFLRRKTEKVQTDKIQPSV